MNETVQAIASDDPARSLDRRLERLAGYSLAKPLVWPSPLVVIDEFAKHVVQMAAAKN